ncbi:dolichyl-phosphate-mannose- mannosyltransferase [Pyrenophora seminiperda CCB06]|uniref:Dolichyl-phosphate-mannose-mannosyltransferase n=1 Tax=Pyrenophora seminiperda CCB06 TaxID=1302712 RepID=A0A3M7M979_9PLEO|nr:dolichyl-phosphate-mannose- mannosyltransferase [Pyrenophora seminiperda CCB06]
MSKNTFSAFQRHLLFFSTPSSPRERPRLTFTSALRASVKLGLDLPVAALLSLSLRLLYAPYPYFWSAIYIDSIPASLHRTQLASCPLPPQSKKEEYTCSDLLALLEQSEDATKGGWVKQKIDQGHVLGFWCMAADSGTHAVRREDVEAFQQGEWEERVAERRRGRGDIVPLWRGGPVWVGGHSWAVGKLLGVRVYEKKGE